VNDDMTERRQPWRSVRIRITAVATLVVAAALTLAAFGLVTAVHHQLIDKVKARDRANAMTVANKLAAGVPIPDALQSSASASGKVTVLDQRGQTLEGSPSALPPGVTPLFITKQAAGQSGGAQVQATVVGGNDTTPFDVRFQAVDTNGGTVTVLAASPLTDVEHSITTLKNTLEGGVPILVVLVALVAWFIVGRALQPVEAIRAEVEAITASTIHRRVPEPPSGDEVNRLARTMNAMLDRLETASTSQRQFVSDASHELRSPIAAIRTEIEVALRTTPEVDWPTVAGNVLAEEFRLEQLVTNLLLLAAADEQNEPHDPTDLDLRTIAREEAARTRAVPVMVVAGDDPVEIRATTAQMTTVVANLLDNAVRFAHNNVSITVARRDGTAQLIVDDDGPGIPVDDRQRVFERFTRLDGSRARTEGGSGLGLAVVKAIVERQHGHVRIEDSETGGARLVMELPMA
jgi:signal transduction histidine kinase